MVRVTDVVLRLIVDEVGGEWRRDCLCDDKSSPLMHGPCRLVIPGSYHGLVRLRGSLRRYQCILFCLRLEQHVPVLMPPTMHAAVFLKRSGSEISDYHINQQLTLVITYVLNALREFVRHKLC